MSLEDPKGAAGGVPSIISPDLEIVGNLKCDGEIQIDGTITGDIEAHELIVGEQGKIDGSTVAQSVRIFGTVNGRVQAKTVRLEKSARVTADIAHETLAIEADAHFEGKMHPLSGASSGGGGRPNLRPAIV
jgi:cytoskeletal protein CcmA (bactofilin family)